MAELFLARATGAHGFNKTVVVKRILSDLADDPNFVDMFLAEARVAAELNHPNVVQIFDFGEAEGTYFIAMEYIDGVNLRRLRQLAEEAGRPLSPAVCAAIVNEAAKGLAHVHQFADPTTSAPRPLVHRDISPDNILLARNGGVKVVDFGIAKDITSSRRTKTGMIKGKIAYMPPEQLRGEAIDRRVDIYALGTVLYELLAGAMPFDATSEVSIMQAIIFEPHVDIAQRRPEIPAALAEVCRRALQKDRELRYGDCHQLIEELEAYVRSCDERVGITELGRLVQELAGPPVALEEASAASGSGATFVASAGAKPNRTIPADGLAATHVRAGSQRVDSQLDKITEPDQPSAEFKIPRSRAPLYLIGGVLIAAAAGAGAWLGLREPAPGTAQPVVTAAPPPEVRPEVATPSDTTPAQASPTEPEVVAAAAAEPTTPRLTSPKSTKASLELVSEPPAMLRVNGKTVGRSPVKLSDLKPGRLEVEAFDPKLGFSRKETLQAKAGHNPSHTIRIGQGRLAVWVRPYATVFLNGKELGQTPFAPVPVWEGRHTLRLVNAALAKDVSLEVTVKAGEERVVKRDLKE
jgi:eukaryotic-like serine/threonine-protein kinase